MADKLWKFLDEDVNEPFKILIQYGEKLKKDTDGKFDYKIMVSDGGGRTEYALHIECVDNNKQYLLLDMKFRTFLYFPMKVRYKLLSSDKEKKIRSVKKLHNFLLENIASTETSMLLSRMCEFPKNASFAV